MFNNVLFFLSFLATFVSFHLSDTSWVRFSVSKETSFEVPVVDVDAQQMFEGIRHCQVKPTRKENDKAIITSFLKYNHTYSRIYRAPIVLLHGFDSSCLEFRRLTPFLQSSIDDREIYIPDILGWGFGNYSEVLDFSPDAKLDHMQSFIKQIVRRPCILVGASLGGGIAVKMGTSKDFSQFVEKICLIDAQVS